MKKEYSLSEIQKVTPQLMAEFETNIICLYGPMGSGKTTLTKALIQTLGAQDPGNSPTFGLVNEYADEYGNVIAYHFDFYRLEDETEAMDIGVEEYFCSDAYAFIEWPEKISSLLPVKRTELRLQFVDEMTRTVEIENF